ncbi:MAG: hypothetical protein RQ743_13650, partial [Bacteroidales bacterium]|nr:hypothetical protein [Bacteroidales bacterium]
DAVKYSYPNEDFLNTILKNNIQKIVFKSGRTQIFNEATSFKKVSNVSNWDNVSVTTLEGEVKGLYKIGDLTIKSKGSGLGSASKVKDRAYRKLKIEAALLGANVILITDETSVGNQLGNKYSAGQVAETQMSGIAYSNALPDFEILQQLLGGKQPVLVRIESLGNNSSDYKSEEIPATQIELSNVRKEGQLIYVTASIQGAKGKDFRVVNINDNEIILMEQHKGKISNYTLVII